MTIDQFLGASMIFLLFAAMFVAGGLTIGWKAVILIYLGTITLCAWVFTASYLLTGEW